MPKKDFTQDIQGTDAFFSNISINRPAPAPAPTPAPVKKTERIMVPEPKIEEQPAKIDGRHARKGAPSFMFSLKLPLEWKETLADEAWKRRMTVTGLINAIISEWIEEHTNK